ncbi:Spondin-1 [Melipona quadrifasciata]|uniref:Spondin-1 n=1 Tax=Melipona quadrifasciata TaxID=166423 RepID=A0A0N1IT92_9HYME|nr:Spondin-1 [Melipona quadrifasciata]
MPDYRIHSLVKLLGDLWQGIEDANEVVSNARESSNVQVQQAVSFKGDVRLVDPGMLFDCAKIVPELKLSLNKRDIVTSDFSGEEETDDSGLLPVFNPYCETTDWGHWSECSSTCGPGLKMRTRRFKDPMGRKRCPHVSIVEKVKCMEQACLHGLEEQIDPTCKVTEWSDWSPCSASCGKGVKLRTRLLMVDPSLQQECSSKLELLQQRPCLEQADCTFDMATAKVVCMEEADIGPCRGYFQRWAFVSQKLTCMPFGYGGCRGNRNNFLTAEECNNTCGIVRALLSGQSLNETDARNSLIPIPKPVHCRVSSWSHWSPCSVTCGIGHVTSYRTIETDCKHLAFVRRMMEIIHVGGMEWFIMAISRFNRTTMLITEYVPNISMPQNLVNALMPSSSKLSRSTSPKTAQNSVCAVSNKLTKDGTEIIS